MLDFSVTGKSILFLIGIVYLLYSASSSCLRRKRCCCITLHQILLSYFYRDGDSVLNSFDNCPDLPNADQADTDKDGKGTKHTFSLVPQFCQ